MEIDLNQIDLEEIGIWPWPVKIGAIVLSSVLILLGGYFLLISGQMDDLSATEKKYKILKTDFETKSAKAALLPLYVEQLNEIKTRLGDMLNQLPNSTEVPNLLEDISKAGKSSGLSFELFKPLPEKQLDVYVELPIQMEVTGEYHQLAEFVSKIAALPRIVTFHDFVIGLPKAANGENTTLPNGALKMAILAKTYRYQQGQGG